MKRISVIVLALVLLSSFAGAGVFWSGTTSTNTAIDNTNSTPLQIPDGVGEVVVQIPTLSAASALYFQVSQDNSAWDNVMLDNGVSFTAALVPSQNNRGVVLLPASVGAFKWFRVKHNTAQTDNTGVYKVYGLREAR